jgi:hypothetical protein
MNRRHAVLAAACVALGTACCSDPVGVRDHSPRSSVNEQLADQLHFLRPAPHAPPVAQKSVSFYAVRGEERQVRIVYHARPGASDSTEFVRFTVPSQALVQRPDGTPVAVGDSVLISLTVTDTLRLIVDFEPTGLRFAAGYPAQLTMSYAETDPDVNGDSVVNVLDNALKSLFQIWSQEQIGDPFRALESLVDKIRQTVSASVPGFTNYAIAY